MIDGKAQWFDSYGMKPDASDLILNDKTNFTTYLKKYSNKIDYNKIDYLSRMMNVIRCSDYGIGAINVISTIAILIARSEVSVNLHCTRRVQFDRHFPTT